MPRNFLSQLEIDEVAFCAEGVNPEAHMLIYKAKKKRRRRSRAKDSNPCKPGIQRIRKDSFFQFGDDMGEPFTFAEAMEDARAVDIDEALDRRLHALLHATTVIMRSDVDNREELILEAVNEYAETMNRDVPELFAGRLAKMLETWGEGEEAPEHDQVCKALITELEAADLVDGVKKGETMNWLDTLKKEDRDRLAFVIGGADPSEFLKGVSDDVGGLVVALVDHAAGGTLTLTERDEQIDTLKADLAKALGESDSDESFETLLKSIDDPNARNLIEIQRAQRDADRAEIAKLQKAARTEKLQGIAKSLDALPNEGLVETLGKVLDAGVLDQIEKILVSANAQAKLAKQFEELGLDSIGGEGSNLSPTEADQALLAKATEIRKGHETSMTPEQAYRQAATEHPDLYEASQAKPN